MSSVQITEMHHPHHTPQIRPGRRGAPGIDHSLVCSTDCVVHVEYAAFQRRLASRLAVNCDRPHSQVMSWVRLKSQFAIIRAVDLRLRGRRRRLFGLSVADGLGPVV